MVHHILILFLAPIICTKENEKNTLNYGKTYTIILYVKNEKMRKHILVFLYKKKLEFLHGRTSW